MNHQYAFAIAFDRQNASANGIPEQLLPAWQTLLSQIAESLKSEGWPELNHPRWEDFGEGHIFWGTKNECDSLKAVLSSLPVSLYEERNLEAGYYSNIEGTYFVNRDGDIWGIERQTDSDVIAEVEPLWTIPLDAYKSKAISAELEVAFQEAIALTKNEPLINPIEKTVDILEQQLDSQSDPLAALESQLNPELDDDFLEGITPSNDQLFGDFFSESDETSAQLSDSPFDQTDVFVADLNPSQELEPLAAIALTTEGDLGDQRFDSTEIEQPAVESPFDPIDGFMADLSLDTEDEILDTSPSIADESLMTDTSESEEILAMQADDSFDLLSEIESVDRIESEEEIEPEDEDELEAIAPPTPESGVQPALESEEIVAEPLDAEPEGFSSEDYESLKQFSVAQGETIATLEQRITALTEELELAIVNQSSTFPIDPEDYSALQTTVSNLNQEIQAFEQKEQQLLAEIEKWTQVANSKIDLETSYEKLSQTNQDQTLQLQAFQQEIDDLKQELSKWRDISSDKVDRVEFEDAVKEIQHLRAKLSRSWLTRLQDWFRKR
jgi:hypothetical protein